MIQKETVFVLGAGASAPYGFPVGSTIVEDIIKADPARLREAIGQYAEKTIKAFQAELRQSAHVSVDAFLEHRGDFKRLGKRCIAHELMTHEQEKSLVTPNRGRWYYELLNIMMADTELDTFNRNRLSVVTFNYDRSFEHFLFIALKARYGKSDKVVADALQHVPIIHVHGQLGLLPWQQHPGGKSRAFNGERSRRQISIAADGIKIVSDAEKSEEFKRAHRSLEQAERIFILGFGFHPDNVQRLQLRTHLERMDGRGNMSIEATCKGFTETEKDAIQLRLGGIKCGHTSWDVHEFLRNSRSFILDSWPEYK